MRDTIGGLDLHKAAEMATRLVELIDKRPGFDPVIDLPTYYEAVELRETLQYIGTTYHLVAKEAS